VAGWLKRPDLRLTGHPWTAPQRLERPPRAGTFRIARERSAERRSRKAALREALCQPTRERQVPSVKMSARARQLAPEVRFADPAAHMLRSSRNLRSTP